MRPDKVLISTILSKPTPTVLKIIDDPSAKIPIKGKTIIDKTKQTPKLLMVFPSGFVDGSINPEWRPDDNLAPKILIKLPLSPENSGSNVSNVGFVSNVSTALFNIAPAEHPKNEHKSKTGVDCFKIVLLSSDNL